MREIQLTRGKVALVDDEDYERLRHFKWSAYPRFNTWYSHRTASLALDDARRLQGRRQTSVSMHREILNAPPGKDVDHVNGNGLDNQKSNLRLVNDSENQQNRLRLTTNTSGFRGVSWNKQSGKWQATIRKFSKDYYLGIYVTKEAAARAYDERARQLFGPAARLNFPNQEAGERPAMPKLGLTR